MLFFQSLWKMYRNVLPLCNPSCQCSILQTGCSRRHQRKIEEERGCESDIALARQREQEMTRWSFQLWVSKVIWLSVQYITDWLFTQASEKDRGRTRVRERHSPGQTERAEGDDQVIISTMSFKGIMVVSAVYYRLVVHAGIRER